MNSSSPAANWKGSDIPSNYTIIYKPANYIKTSSTPTFIQDQDITAKSLTVSSGTIWQINKTSTSGAVTLTLNGDDSGGAAITNNGSITFGGLTVDKKATITSHNTSNIPWSGNAPTWR